MPHDLWGYADLHCHPMAHLGFGGPQRGRALIFGAPTGPLDQALPCCNHAHELIQGGTALGAFLDHAHAGYCGYPDFDGWPRHDQYLHQQMYVDWVKRAHASGLRLMIGSAVNNELLTSFYHGPHVNASDTASTDAQLAAMKQMVKDNASWMALATSPADARSAIAAGKLALILGVEVDSPLGGAARKPDDYDRSAAARVVDRWFAAGVRLVTPIHLADSAIGGCAIFDDRFALSNHHLHDLYEPSLPEKEKWFEIDADPSRDLAGVEFLSGGNAENASLITLYRAPLPGYRSIRRDGHVNVRGLSAGGAHFVRSLMHKGMLVDVDHMSARSCDATIDLAEHAGYPLVSSHCRFRALAMPRPAGRDWVRGVADEGMRCDAQLRRMNALGSIFGIITHLGPVRGIGGRSNRRTRAYDTSESWAIAYRHAVERLGLSKVAIGSDFNGFFAQPGPRFEKGNQNELTPLTSNPTPVRYGHDVMPRMQRAIDRSLVGKRSFDLNVDGLAHYGMVPDFLVDVATQAGGWSAVEPFFRSAEAAITTWERCIAQGAHVTP